MTKAKEIWKPVKGYEGYYDVSNMGRVRSLPRMVPDCMRGIAKVEGGLLKQFCDRSGTYRTGLSKSGETKTFAVKNLVADAFIENPNGFKYIKQIDGNKQNCCAENLEWSEHNARFGVKFGHYKKTEHIKFEVVAPENNENKPAHTRHRVKVYRRGSMPHYRLGTLALLP